MAATSGRRVLLVHGHTESRQLLADLLSQHFVLVRAIEQTQDVEKQVNETTPDVVVLDVDLPGTAGIEGIQRICEWFPDVRIVGLSSVSETVHVREVLKAGAAAYVLKQGATVDLIQAIDEVAEGRTYLSGSLRPEN